MRVRRTCPAIAPEGRTPGWQRVLAWILVATALLAVFAAYLQPDMAMQLALQLWNCF